MTFDVYEWPTTRPNVKKNKKKKKLEAEGFKRGTGAPTVFYNSKTAVRVVVHGDDFTFSGTKGELEKVRGKMDEWYDIKNLGTMGSGAGEIKEVTILGGRCGGRRKELSMRPTGSTGGS